MSLKTLAEAIMLQSAEDFLSEDRQEEDLEFFCGEGFRICSEIAGMDHEDKCKLLNLLMGSAPVCYRKPKKIAAGGGGVRVLHA
jgi:hypothetical protein